MKTSISHLPKSKQEQINNIVSLINKVIPVDKIILYGSYAKGTYQEGNYTLDGILYEYISDFDILIIINEKNLPEYEIQDRIINQIHYKTPVNLNIFFLDQVNEGLEKGQYFFTEIIETGIILYDKKIGQLLPPRLLSPTERRKNAQDDFEFWFGNGSQFLESAILLFNNAVLRNGKTNLVAHQLHQAVESFFGATLLVFTGYKPKLHNLEKYRKLLKNVSNEVANVFSFPAKSKEDSELFALLKRAYVSGKYNKNYEIENIQLEYLIQKVGKLEEIVKIVCLKRIDEF